MKPTPSAMHRFLKFASKRIPRAARGLAASAFALGILIVIGTLLVRSLQNFVPALTVWLAMAAAAFRSARCPLFRSR